VSATRMRSARCAVVGAMCAIASVAAADEPIIEAVWKPQHVAFLYTSSTTRYNCRELASKLKRVLQTLGAHEDIHVDHSACSEVSARLRVRFKSPVPATAANVVSITTYDATEQLAARLNKQTLPTSEALPRFAATWHEVSFARHPSLRLDSSDCQFVEDVRRQMLPRLAATTTSNRLFCTPGFPGISRPKLKVKVLLAAAALDR